MTTCVYSMRVGLLYNFLVEKTGGGAIATQTAGTAFSLRITARDANNNAKTDFTGTATLTSTGVLVGAPVTTVAFTAGGRGPQSGALTNTGNLPITAPKSGETGASNAVPDQKSGV